MQSPGLARRSLPVCQLRDVDVEGTGLDTCMVRSGIQGL